MRSRILVLIVIVVIAVGAYVFYTQQVAQDSGAFTLSGTIEATETQISAQIGGQVKNVFVDEGDQVQKGQHVVDLYLSTDKVNEKITSPISGVVLERLVQPGEITGPGSTLLVVAPLDSLTLKVFVPENRYGLIALGQTYPVTVDSFPNETFNGTVSSIANKAEFTPRNVQTTDSRQSTVFAVKLNLEASSGKLKPGMPADVHFQVTPQNNVSVP